MKKILLASILLASSLFANKTILKKEPLFSCDKNWEILGEHYQNKGNLVDSSKLQNFNVDDFLNPTNLRFDSISFLKDGFFYDGKLYKFENNFSQSFFDSLKEANLFKSVCEIVPTNFQFVPTSKSKNFEVVNLDVNTQILFANYVKEVAKNILLHKSVNNGIVLGTDENFFFKDITNPKKLDKAIENIALANEKLEMSAKKQNERDKKNKAIAESKKLDYFIYANAFAFNKFLNLKGATNEN